MDGGDMDRTNAKEKLRFDNYQVLKVFILIVLLLIFAGVLLPYINTYAVSGEVSRQIGKGFSSDQIETIYGKPAKVYSGDKIADLTSSAEISKKNFNPSEYSKVYVYCVSDLAECSYIFVFFDKSNKAETVFISIRVSGGEWHEVKLNGANKITNTGNNEEIIDTVK
jgi:hypothetical protein